MTPWHTKLLLFNMVGGSRYTPGQSSNNSSLGSYNPWGNDAPKPAPAAPKRLIPQVGDILQSWIDDIIGVSFFLGSY